MGDAFMLSNSNNTMGHLWHRPLVCLKYPVFRKVIRKNQRVDLGRSALPLPDVIDTVQELAKVVAWYGAYVYHHRPRGWSRQDLLETKQSSLGENAGLGVFSKHVIGKDTVLGSYPGFVRNDRDMTAKSIVAPMSRYYCFSTRPGCIIDPTGEDGYPSKHPTPSSGTLSWWPFDVDTMLSYVNEPSINQNVSVNVRVEDDPDDPLVGLIFRADRDIQAGEELFIDYGTQYDRSMYGE